MHYVDVQTVLMLSASQNSLALMLAQIQFSVCNLWPSHRLGFINTVANQNKYVGYFLLLSHLLLFLFMLPTCSVKPVIMS